MENQVIYYAHKMAHRNQDGHYFLDSSPHRWWVELFGREDTIATISIRPRESGDPPSPYWGWLGSNSEFYSLVWPSEAQFETCFPYGSKAEEDRGKGRKINLVIQETLEVPKKKLDI